MTVDEAKKILFEANLRSIERVALQVLLSELDSKALPGEIWRNIIAKDINYNGKYQVSNYARIKSFNNGKVKILNPAFNGHYFFVSLYKNGIGTMHYVHILVARAFIPNPDNKPCVNHIDGNKSNNRVENLEWCTQSENAKHAFEMGLSKSGCENGNAKLTEEQVREIRRDCVPGDLVRGFKPFAQKFSVIPEVISDVFYRRTYKNVD